MVERTTIRIFGLMKKTEQVEVGFAEAMAVVQDPRGFPLIRALYVTSPHTVTITEEWKNIKAKDLRAYFIPLNEAEYVKEEINTANLHSRDGHVLDRIFGIKYWSWKS